MHNVFVLFLAVIMSEAKDLMAVSNSIPLETARGPSLKRGGYSARLRTTVRGLECRSLFGTR
jgi:hypothetical protein